MGAKKSIATGMIYLFGASSLLASPLQTNRSGLGDSSVKKITFQDFINQVSQSHPEKAIDQLDIGMAQAREKKSGRLFDPQISLTGEDFPLKKMGADEMDSSSAQSPSDVSKPKWTLNVTQTFPWPGTLHREKMQAQVSRKKDEVTTSISQMRRLLDAQILFIDMVTFNRLIFSEKENLREVENILKSAQTRLKYGVGSHHDSIEAHHEKILLQLTIDAMGENLEVLKLRAAQMLGLESSERIFFDLDDSVLNIQQINPSKDPPVDFSQVQISLEEALAQEKKDLEDLRAAPSLMAGGMIMKMQGESGTSLGLMMGMSLPLYGGSFREGVDEEYRLAIKKSRQIKNLYEKQKKLTLNTLDRREKIALAQFEGLKAQIVPSAQEHLRTIAVEYGIGKTSYATVNRARRQLLKYNEAKIYAERELAWIKVARVRVSHGILDQDLSAMMPQISLGDSMGADSKSMGSSMENDSSRGGMQNTMPSSNGRPSLQRRRPDSFNPMEEQNENTPGRGSMGEM